MPSEERCSKRRDTEVPYKESGSWKHAAPQQTREQTHDTQKALDRTSPANRFALAVAMQASEGDRHGSRFLMIGPALSPFLCKLAWDPARRMGGGGRFFVHRPRVVPNSLREDAVSLPLPGARWCPDKASRPPRREPPAPRRWIPMGPQDPSLGWGRSSSCCRWPSPLSRKARTCLPPRRRPPPTDGAWPLSTCAPSRSR